MTALALRLLDRIAAPLITVMTWKCDRCQAINSDSVTHCYRCGA